MSSLIYLLLSITLVLCSSHYILMCFYISHYLLFLFISYQQVTRKFSKTRCQIPFFISSYQVDNNSLSLSYFLPIIFFVGCLSLYNVYRFIFMIFEKWRTYYQWKMMMNPYWKSCCINILWLEKCVDFLIIIVQSWIGY